MTIKEFQVKLGKQIKNLRIFSDPLRLAAFNTTAQMGERIFEDGKKTDQSQIGQYSTKPTYISLAVAPKPKGAPVGKTGKSKFKNGTPHKSKYFPLGYKGYRENVGRQSAKIDLSLTGELRMDFGNQKTVAEPVKINELEYQIRLNKPINQDKREGAEDRFGTIFTPSKTEINLFFDTIQSEFNKRLSASK